MPRLKTRLHERFAWLIAEGMDRKAAYTKLCPHVAGGGKRLQRAFVNNGLQVKWAKLFDMVTLTIIE